MNERIKELSAIAKNLTTDEAIHLSRIHNRTLSLDEFGEIFDQKFAELIVRECLAHIEQDQVRQSFGAHELDEDYDNGYYYGIQRAGRVLKEHFGVKE